MVEVEEEEAVELEKQLAGSLDRTWLSVGGSGAVLASLARERATPKTTDWSEKVKMSFLAKAQRMDVRAEMFPMRLPAGRRGR